MGFFEDVGGAIGDVASMVGSAILGKEVKKTNAKTGKTTTQREGGVVGAFEGGFKLVTDTTGGAASHMKKQMQRYGHLPSDQPQVGQQKGGYVLAEKVKDPGTGQTIEHWVTPERWEAYQRVQRQRAPTAQSVGWQYSHETVHGVVRPKRDPFLPAKSATGTILELDLGGMFGMHGDPYYRGLAQWVPYEEKPVKVLTSPAAVTGYTAVISYGAGSLFGFGLGKASGALAKPHYYNPIVRPTARVGGKVGRQLVPKGTTLGQAGLGVAGAGLMTYGAYSSGKRIQQAGQKRTEVVKTEKYGPFTIERGGPAGAVRQTAQEAMYWTMGIRGAMGKPMFPLLKQGIRSHVYPEYRQTLAPRYIKDAINRQYPTVKGKNFTERINNLFLRPDVREQGLPLKITSKAMANSLYNQTGLKLPVGSRLVVHATREPFLGFGGKAQLKSLYVTPAEGLSTPFLNLGYRNVSLIPQERALTSRPKAIMLFAKSGKRYNPLAFRDWFIGRTGKQGSLPGRKLLVPKALSPKDLFIPREIRGTTLRGAKPEIEAGVVGYGEFKQQLPKMNWLQRALLPFFGKTPYYYEIPSSVGVTRKAVPAYLIEYTGKPLPRPAGTAGYVKGVQTAGPTSGPFVAPYYPYLPSPQYYQYYSPRTSYQTPSYGGASRSASSAPAISTPSRTSLISPVEFEAPPAYPKPKGGEPPELKRYEIPEQLDYYNELKEAYVDLFGG